MIDFRAVLTTLTEAGVRFIIVRDAAATAHGAPRLSQDLDVVDQRDAEYLRLLPMPSNPTSPICAPQGRSAMASGFTTWKRSPDLIPSSW